MKKLEIEIPDNKEIDWEASAKQKQIVFKDKQLTYDDICDKLFDKGHFYVDTNGKIQFINRASICPNNATTCFQLECILAKNKLANVARWFNANWKWELGNHDAYVIVDKSFEESEYDFQIMRYTCYTERPNVLFKTKKAAEQAIEILGEETVKLALTPLY